jgi:putative hydrolase of the HAD superfamily
MQKLFNGIMSVGFDLDQTLYPRNYKIDNIISENIARKVLEKKQGVYRFNEFIFFFEEEYRKIGSRTQILKNLGYLDAEDIMQASLESPSILNLLKKDKKLVSLLRKIKEKYEIFLVTASPKELAIKKLCKIGIDPCLFNISIFGDTLNAGKKLDGSIFRYFLGKSNHLPEQHVYVGDSLNADIIPAKSLGMKTVAVGEEMPEADFSIKKIYSLENILL